MKDTNLRELTPGRKTIIGRPPVEAFMCPKCNNIMLQEKAEKKEDNIFIFKCRVCKNFYQVELNNIKCVNCKTLIKKEKAFEIKFCSLKCYNEYNNIELKLDNKESTNKKNTNCRFCKKGICRNDDNSYYYGQTCPVDCDFFLR